MNSFFEKYKELAKASQRVSGVPASITLAQAYLESGAGKSLLTVQDNNFFGTKAGSNWIGAKSLWKTTEYIPISKKDYYRNYFSTNGREIISVIPYNAEKEKWTVKDYFRKYNDAESAFTDHSQIYAVRKAKTIANGSLDYKIWANALKTAGYATDINYPNKLITIIEQNNLAVLDADGAKKKLTNYTIIAVLTTVLLYGIIYWKNRKLLSETKNIYFVFFVSVILGIFIYLVYLKTIEMYYQLQN